MNEIVKDIVAVFNIYWIWFIIIGHENFFELVRRSGKNQNVVSFKRFRHSPYKMISEARRLKMKVKNRNIEVSFHARFRDNGLKGVNLLSAQTESSPTFRQGKLFRKFQFRL